MTKGKKRFMACLLAVAMVLSTLLELPGGLSGKMGLALTAHAQAEAITPSQPENGDGSTANPYKIGTAAELYWFAGLVNNDASVCTGEVTKNTAANAVLTADITVNTNVLDAAGNLKIATGDAITWTPIGTSSNRYTGTFDGGGHTVSGLYFDDENTSGVGLFGYVGSGCSVSNVGVVDSYFYGDINVGGVCGWNYGIIEDSYSSGAVGGDNWPVGGVCGSNWGELTNCYYDKTVAAGVDAIGDSEYGTDNKVLGKTTNQFKSGQVAYLLNGSTSTGTLTWGQILSGVNPDTYPVFHNDSNTVYATKGCVTYSNDENKVGEIDHNFVDGICTDCGAYEISTKEQLSSFAAAVNNGENDINAVLAADITVNKSVLDEEGNLQIATDVAIVWTPIGNYSNPYTGTFDGGGHTVSGLYFDNEGASSVGLFGRVGGGGIVSNVGVADSYFYGNDRVGGVCGENSGIIKCSYNTGVVSGDFSVGGVCGVNTGTIEGCYNGGTVSVESSYVGGVCGYNMGAITNCYYDETVAAGVDAIRENHGTATKVLGKTTDQFKSGEVAYLLNGSTSEGTLVWGQKIGKDTYPVFHNDSNTVYATKGCVTYNNDKNEVGEKKHVCAGGSICTDCGKYVISSTDDLRSFGLAVSGGAVTMDAVLTADITVNKDVLDAEGNLQIATDVAIDVWTPIGTEENPYTGTFDGGGHTISGLYFDDQDTSRVGLFGCVGKGGIVSAVGVVDSYFSGLSYVGGVCGRNYGTIKDSYNSGAVSGSEAIGGVCGNNWNGTIEDSYNSGNVSGSERVGGVCGDNFDGSIQGSHNSGNVSGSEKVGGMCGENCEGTIQDSYNSGAVSGSNGVGGVCGYNDGTIKGNYNSGAVGVGSRVGGVCGVNRRTIEGCYNSGAVSGSNGVGGVCGLNDEGIIKGCYNSGAVGGTTEYVGGVCGYCDVGTIEGCYYNSDICTAGAIELEDVTGQAVGLTTLQMTAADALTTMKLGSGWEKKPADTKQKKVFYPDLAAIKEDETSVTYEAVLVLTNINTNINPVYGDDLSFTLDASVKFGGIEESVSLIGSCTAKDFKLLYKGENVGSVSGSGSTMTALVRGGVDAGNQTISLQYVGSRYDFLSGLTGDCPVTIGKAIPKIVVTAGAETIRAGETVTVSAIAVNPNDEALTDVPEAVITYRIGDGAEQTVTNGAIVIPKDTVSGTAITITATTPETDNYKAGTDTTVVTVTEKENDVLMGDVNGDGNVTAEDALAILKHVVGLEEITGDSLTSADVNADTGITAEDALDVLKKVVGLLDKFKAEM